MLDTMKAKFKCACEQIFIVDDKWFGRKIRCPKCQRPVKVPVPPGFKREAEPGEPTAGADAPATANGDQEGVSAEEPEPEQKTLKASAGGLEIEFEDPADMPVAADEAMFAAPELGMGVADLTGAAAGGEASATDETMAPASETVSGGGEPSGAQIDPSTLTSCPHCDNDLAPGAVFCVNCGTDLRSGRKLRKVIVEEEDTGPSYEPPVDGKCCMCGEEAVPVVEVPRDEFAASKRVMKVVRKLVDSKDVTVQELQTALSVKIGGGLTRPLCEKCAKKFKIGPRKFADLIPEEEPPEGEAQAEAEGPAEGKTKSGLFAKLKRKKK